MTILILSIYNHNTTNICFKHTKNTHMLLVASYLITEYPKMNNNVCGSTGAYWLRFKGFYIQVWDSNPRLCNLLQITGNPGFKSRKDRFIKQLCRLQRKGLQEIFNMVQVNLVSRGSS